MHDQKHFHDIFSAVVERHSGRTAVAQADQSITYSQLDQRAREFARVLHAHGVEAGDVVAVNLDRSIDLIVTFVAILKTGAIYLPLDTASPTARLNQCLDIAKVRVVVSNDSVDDLLNDDRISLDSQTQVSSSTPDAAVIRSLTKDSPAYIMFTSGSTGDPKGVVVPYRAIVRLVVDSNFVTISAQDSILQFSPVSFDASTFEIWGALLNGAKLVLYSGEVLDPSTLKSDIQSHGVTIAWLTAALFHLIASNYIEALSPLRVLLAGGDVLKPDVVNHVLNEIPGITLINGYGPTENTTFTCCHCMTKENPPSAFVPIGKAISGTEVFILDENRQEVAPTEVGELYAAGLGVALGYLGDDEKQSSFFRDPLLSSTLIYRTGDLVRMNGAGEIEFIGRNDNQVKIRGFRVSLEEVCANLIKNQRIENVVAFVDKQEGGDQLLVAYLQVNSKHLGDVDEIRAELAKSVPTYMIPDQMVLGTDLPMNKNGKLDRSKIVSEHARKQ